MTARRHTSTGLSAAGRPSGLAWVAAAAALFAASSAPAEAASAVQDVAGGPAAIPAAPTSSAADTAPAANRAAPGQEGERRGALVLVRGTSTIVDHPNTLERVSIADP